MKKILGALTLMGLLFGVDFSKVSNDELAKMIGKVEAKDFIDYHIELHKRMDQMTKAQIKDFRKKIHEYKEKNTENMTLKQLREQREAIREAVKKRVEHMDKEECKKSGVCEMYKHIKKEAKHRDKHFMGCGMQDK